MSRRDPEAAVLLYVGQWRSRAASTRCKTARRTVPEVMVCGQIQSATSHNPRLSSVQLGARQALKSGQFTVSRRLLRQQFSAEESSDEDAQDHG
jgi:hypothetical protein